jgi:hypothetical protein
MNTKQKLFTPIGTGALALVLAFGNAGCSLFSSKDSPPGNNSEVENVPPVSDPDNPAGNSNAALPEEKSEPEQDIQNLDIQNSPFSKGEGYDLKMDTLEEMVYNQGARDSSKEDIFTSDSVKKLYAYRNRNFIVFEKDGNYSIIDVDKKDLAASNRLLKDLTGGKRSKMPVENVTEGSPLAKALENYSSNPCTYPPPYFVPSIIRYKGAHYSAPKISGGYDWAQLEKLSQRDLREIKKSYSSLHCGEEMPVTNVDDDKDLARFMDKALKSLEKKQKSQTPSQTPANTREFYPE